jgi:adenylate cyclase
MGTEPERKFLLANDDWKSAVTATYEITQAYLSKDPSRVVRIRSKGDHAYITVKGRAPEGTIDTPEFEYEIPKSDLPGLMALCLPGAITKTRHIVPFGGKNWEVDVFSGANTGLILAEIELNHGKEAFDLPPWAGTEITDDKRYSNAALSENPYSGWKKNPVTRNRPPSAKM